MQTRTAAFATLALLRLVMCSNPSYTDKEDEKCRFYLPNEHFYAHWEKICFGPAYPNSPVMPEKRTCEDDANDADRKRTKSE
jgi:hypothetical protein